MNLLQNPALRASLGLLGRLAMAFIFVVAGYNKVVGFAATQGWMASLGVPGVLLYPVVVLELGGGLALIFGYQTRWVALLLSGFCVVSALLFHGDLANDFNNFAKNIAMAGGFLLLALNGAGRFSLDARRAS